MKHAILSLLSADRASLSLLYMSTALLGLDSVTDIWKTDATDNNSKTQSNETNIKLRLMAAVIIFLIPALSHGQDNEPFNFTSLATPFEAHRRQTLHRRGLRRQQHEHGEVHGV